MTCSNPNADRLAELEGKIDHDDNDNEQLGRADDLVAILQDACNLIRGADGDAPNFKAMVDSLGQLINTDSTAPSIMLTTTKMATSCRT